MCRSKSSSALSKPGLLPRCSWMTSQSSSSLSSPSSGGRRTSQAFRCGHSPGAAPRPHHQTASRALPQSTTTRSSSGVRKPTTDWYRGCPMKLGRSERSATLSWSPACWLMYCRTCAWMYWMAESTSSGFGWDSTRTPVALLRCVGLTITSSPPPHSSPSSPSPQRCSRTKCPISSAASSKCPSIVRRAGICGIPRFSSSRCSISLSPSAWIVRLPALSSFMTAMTPGRSNLRPFTACEMSNSLFMENERAARSQGSTSTAGGATTGGGTTGTMAGAGDGWKASMRTGPNVGSRPNGGAGGHRSGGGGGSVGLPDTGTQTEARCAGRGGGCCTTGA
mmetsp:Transcript_25228/g.71135  ORF Transcript_25228/g.71135 Transcript_25228/m.71135 type:complete len:336 (+) Transcript_25228:696-1703(+)